MSINKDYNKCEAIIKEASKTFYQAFSLLKDQDARKAVYGVYAYCRLVDDIIDEHHDLAGLIKVKNDLDQYVLRKEKPDFIFRVINDISNKFYPKNYDYKPFYDMIEGQKMDLTIKDYKTLEELLAYCTKVASSVGEMLMLILAPNKDKTKLKQVAYDLGIAMQLTNILRDIGEDYQKGRIYIPREIMTMFNVNAKQLELKIIDDSFITMFDYIGEIAYQYYDKAQANLVIFPEDSRMILTMALMMYKAIIKACKNNNYDVFNYKNAVSNAEKLQIIKEIKNT